MRWIVMQRSWFQVTWPVRVQQCPIKLQVMGSALQQCWFWNDANVIPLCQKKSLLNFGICSHIHVLDSDEAQLVSGDLACAGSGSNGFP